MLKLISSLAICLSTLTACSVRGGGDDSNGGKGGNGPASPTSVKCAQGLRICVEDMILIYKTSVLVESGKVLEIVPAGALAKSEIETIAQTRARDPRVAEQLESIYRSQANTWGLRIFTTNNPYNGFYSHDELKALYATDGCAATGKLCVGEKTSEWEDSYQELAEQSIIGISVDPKANTPLLTKTKFKTRNERYDITGKLFSTYAATGCTLLGNSKTQVCVGERFWIYNGNTSENRVVFVPQLGKGPPVIRNETGRIYQWTRDQEEGVYVEQGCVAGMPEFCFPELANRVILMESSSIGGSVLNSQILGIVIPEFTNPRNDNPILVRSALEASQMTGPQPLDSRFYRVEGCTTDGKICVGRTYKYKYEFLGQQSILDFKVSGINNSKQLAMGTFRLNDMDVKRAVKPSELSN